MFSTIVHMRKKITVLGASGSIGSQTLDILLQHQDEFEIIAISVGKRVQVLKDYLDKYPLSYACVQEQKDFDELSKQYPDTTFYYGDLGLEKLASLDNIDVVCNALQGIVGLIPTIRAMEHHADVAIANKESLVAAGDIVNELSREYNATLIPVDSEHSAIFQTLNGYDKKDIKKLIITASGGSFRELNREQLKNVTLQQALKHPRWHMGAKITIDSATMMNKGFEVIEAHVLFGLPYEQIDVILHPQSIIHSMTEFVDHSIIAQLAVADMRVPIQYALTYPKRIINTTESLSLAEIGSLTFSNMDYERFPLLDLAYAVGLKGGNMTAILNGANEMAVDMFLNNEISFIDIERINFETIRQAKDVFIEKPTLEEILESNKWATEKAKELAEVK